MQRDELLNLRKDLRKCVEKGKVDILSRFFKTGPGEYGEGDVFLGVTVPNNRKVAKKYSTLDWGALKELLKSKFHEERLLALFIMTHQFQHGDDKTKIKIYNHYMKSTKYINNWDLIDSSAHKIVGPYLEKKSKKPLIDFAKSNDLWKRRISVISTFAYINKNEFKISLQIADLLLNDKHDLIHKAVGWMLREIGKKDHKTEKEYLNKHYKIMPRTMLRYAIERFAPKEKKYFMG